MKKRKSISLNTEKTEFADLADYDAVANIPEEQVERIKCMESFYDRIQEMLEMNSSELQHHREMIGLLQEYYEGPLWKEDFEADEAGQLPADLKRGVLSEDGLYNLLERVSDHGII